MSYIVLDFETASACDLKKSGADAYAEDPTTEILCLSVQPAGREPFTLWPENLFSKSDCSLKPMVDDPECTFVVHGARFERAIWTHIMVGRYGWPELPISRWHCTQAVAFMKGLPGDLDKLATELGLKQQKDTEGSALTISLSKPRPATKKNVAAGVAGTLDRSPDTLARVGRYCEQDDRVETEVLSRLGGFPKPGKWRGERSVWELDQRINDRGVMLDREFIEAGIAICQAAIPDAIKRFNAITKINPGQTAKFKAWLKAEGVPVDNLQKATVAKLLGEEPEEADDAEGDESDDIEVPPHCLEALQLRALTTSASVSKLPRMLECMTIDDRAHNLLQYHGAGPGRWAGRLLQPHNFPRVTGLGFMHDTTDLVDAILARDVAYLTAVYDNPIAAVSGGLRHAIVAAKGKKLNMGDFTQVEARMVLALAGATKGVEAFVKNDPPPYCIMAESIYHRPISKKHDVPEYTIGKNTILGCGFQMGVDTFHKRYCPDATIEFAEEAIHAYRYDFAPEVPKLWKGLEKAGVDCVWEKRTTEAYGCEFRLEGEWLTIRIPSGRKLWYYNPKPIRKAMRWSTEDEPDVRPTWTSRAYKQGRMITRDMYGGLITENVVQGLARDAMVEAMFRCEDEGMSIVLTVHDEIVDESDKDVKLLEQCMLERSPWLQEIKMPVGTECDSFHRYKK